MNSGIIAVVSYKGIILSKMGNFLSTAQKHNRYSFKCNRPGPTHNTHTTHTHTEPIKAHITNKKVHKLSKWEHKYIHTINARHTATHKETYNICTYIDIHNTHCRAHRQAYMKAKLYIYIYIYVTGFAKRVLYVQL